MANLCETVYLDAAPTVNADTGFITGAKLLGMESRNKRRYTKEAMQSAVSLYEGRKIYIDHPKRSDIDSDRSMDRWAGTIQNARFESDGIYGDIKLRKKSDFFEGIIEAATEFPKDVGFSHVADGESQFEGDTEIVESIREVFSVDLVTDPATTAGFFESHRKPKSKTVKAAIESLPDGPVRKRLIEMAGYMGGDLSLDADEKPADPFTQMSALVRELIQQLGEALKALANKKDAPPPATAPQSPEDDMEDQQKSKELKAAFESLKAEHEKTLKENAALKAKILLLESGREASDVRVKALAEAQDADRQPLLESWPVLEGDERPARSPALLESAYEHTDFPRDDSAKFAASLR